VTIDYKNKTLAFESNNFLIERRKRGHSFHLYLVEKTAPYVSIVLNKNLRVKNKYKIDTGAGKTYLRLQDIKELGISKSSLKEKEGNSLAGKYKKYEGIIDSLALNDSIFMKNLSIGAYETPIGFIGADFLKNYVVTLNYPGNEIIFQ